MSGDLLHPQPHGDGNTTSRYGYSCGFDVDGRFAALDRAQGAWRYARRDQWRLVHKVSSIATTARRVFADHEWI